MPDEILKKLNGVAYYKRRPKILQELALFVPPSSCATNENPYLQDDEAPLLKDTVIGFMRSQKKVLLIKGGAGFGKSSFGWYLEKGCYEEQDFFKELADPTEPLVIVISLPDIKDPIHHLIEGHFSQLFPLEEVDEIIKILKNRENTVFVLDGFEEIQAFQPDPDKILPPGLVDVRGVIPEFGSDPNKIQNLYMSNHLDEWKPKFIINCRSEFLQGIALLKGCYKSYFAPINNDGFPKFDLYEEVQIGLFNIKQVQQYYHQFLVESQGHHPENLADIEAKKAEMLAICLKDDSLKILMREPLSLKMIPYALLTVLDWHAAKKQIPGSKITHRDLFLAYTRNILLRLENRLRQNGVTVPKNFKPKCLDFLINLSYQMTSRSLLRVAYPLEPKELETNINQSRPWETKFFGNPFLNQDSMEKNFALLTLIREALSEHFIIYENGNWRFVHLTYRERLTSINAVELSNIQSKLRLTMSAAATRVPAIDEFSRALFEERDGPYFFYQR